MNEIRFKQVVAKNIAKYRKIKKLTQLELAEKLNYTDKAVSKWERGESLPDVIVLKEIADILGISLDILITDETEKRHKIGMFSIKKKLVIPILSVGLVWVISTLAFAFFNWFKMPFYSSYGDSYNYWLVFIYSLPISLIILLIFSEVWGNKIISGIFASMLIWTIAVSIHLSLTDLSIEDMWLIYIVGIPLQIIVVLWFFLKNDKKKKMPKSKEIKQKNKQDTPE